ncbi:MAG: manganese efflux pump, partial [Lachnospiraceae bacterium]|nr:manganese efflux pump [Lachnospiraceae bacterium]
MQGTFYFVFNSILLGFGLAMDAFSVSIADGIQNASMKRREMVRIAGTFAFFQCLMPLLGWLCVHEAVRAFSFMEKFIPWIALLLLA